MKLNITGEISEFYVQTLCLIYFPGSKFSKKDCDQSEIEVNVNSVKCNSGYKAFVDIKTTEGVFSGFAETRDISTLSNPFMAEKITVGKAFIEAGSKMCSFVPRWGILTGVRPSKFAIKSLISGKDFNTCVENFVNDYGVFPSKASLAVKVAMTERAVISDNMYNECSLYIAIPFCPSRCSYCSFVSFTSEKLLSLIPEYLSVLSKEIYRKAALIKKLGIKLTTVYIGGGTPTVLNESQLCFLLDTVCDAVDTENLCEFTLEAGRPDTITKEKLRIAKDHNVTRISVNTQTLNDEVLSSIGRRHNSDDFFNAYYIAKNSGIKHVNVDLIAGLPGESTESFVNSIDKVIELEPDNITVHTFCVKKASDIRRNTPNVYSAENAVACSCIDYSQKVLPEHDYIPYYLYRQKNTMGNLENVGYAKKGSEGLYNILMMEELQSVFAVGASAVTKLVHYSKDDKTVIERIGESKYPYEYLNQKKSETDDGFERRVFDFYDKYFE